jgi:hypothetical protein
MKDLIQLNFLKRKTPWSVMGLALDGSRLEGVVLRRSNGSLHVNQSFQATLSLDLLTNDAELIGREILNHLEAAGVRERRCVVAVPLTWALAAHTQIPDLPENDVPEFLQLEAERGFPTDPATLQVATSRLVSPSGARHATFIGIPKAHLVRLEQILRAAKLRPLGFSLGITALQPASPGETDGVLALVIGQNQVGLQITCGGGVAALRALEGALETENGERTIQGDFIAREARITLGQLPADLRDSIKRIRVYGPRTQAEKLIAELRPRFESAGLKLEFASAYAGGEFERTIPSGTAVSPMFSLAARQLDGRKNPFEFLPPKISAWREAASRYASGKWRTAGAAAAALLILVGGAFGVQQWRLARLRSQWAAMSAKVKELNDIQERIQKYRPWFDESLRYLSVLRAVTTAFPEDSSVTAKTLEIRELPDDPGASAVSCSGNANGYAALQKTVHQLGEIDGVSDLNVPTRGKAPVQFSLDFHIR